MKQLIKKILLRIIYLFTIKNSKYVVFESSDYFYDNSFAMCKYVRNNFPNFKIKYIIRNREQLALASSYGFKRNEIIRAYRWNSVIPIYKYGLKSKAVFISYHNYFKDLKLTSHTSVVYLGHGEFPLKDCTKYYRGIFDASINNNYFCVPTDFSKIEQIKHYPVLSQINVNVCGMPRNDDMFNGNLSKKHFLQLIGYNGSSDSSLIFCLCTFRKMYDSSVALFDDFPLRMSSADLEKINQQLIYNNQVLVLKIHHAQRDCLIPKNLSNILFIDNRMMQREKIFLHSIYPLADAMLTDYSTSYISYLDVDRPIGFITADEDYYKKDRGFTVSNVEELMPGKKIKTLDELLAFFNELLNNNDDYVQARQKVKELLLGNYKDGNCKSVADIFLK